MYDCSPAVVISYKKGGDANICELSGTSNPPSHCCSFPSADCTLFLLPSQTHSGTDYHTTTDDHRRLAPAAADRPNSPPSAFATPLNSVTPDDGLQAEAQAAPPSSYATAVGSSNAGWTQLEHPDEIPLDQLAAVAGVAAVAAVAGGSVAYQGLGARRLGTEGQAAGVVVDGEEGLGGVSCGPGERVAMDVRDGDVMGSRSERAGGMEVGAAAAAGETAVGPIAAGADQDAAGGATAAADAMPAPPAAATASAITVVTAVAATAGGHGLAATPQGLNAPGQMAMNALPPAAAAHPLPPPPPESAFIMSSFSTDLGSFGLDAGVVGTALYPCVRANNFGSGATQSAAVSAVTSAATAASAASAGLAGTGSTAIHDSGVVCAADFAVAPELDRLQYPEVSFSSPDTIRMGSSTKPTSPLATIPSPGVSTTASESKQLGLVDAAGEVQEGGEAVADSDIMPPPPPAVPAEPAVAVKTAEGAAGGAELSSSAAAEPLPSAATGVAAAVAAAVAAVAAVAIPGPVSAAEPDGLASFDDMDFESPFIFTGDFPGVPAEYDITPLVPFTQQQVTSSETKQQEEPPASPFEAMLSIGTGPPPGTAAAAAAAVFAGGSGVTDSPFAAMMLSGVLSVEGQPTEVKGGLNPWIAPAEQQLVESLAASSRAAASHHSSYAVSAGRGGPSSAAASHASGPASMTESPFMAGVPASAAASGSQAPVTLQPIPSG